MSKFICKSNTTYDYFQTKYVELYSNDEFVKQIHLKSDKFKQITINENGMMPVSTIEIEKNENGYFDERECKYDNITNILFK